MITIIVLLILVSISISTLSGKNSITDNANYAKELSEISEEKENIETAVVLAMGKNKYGNLVEEELKSELANLYNSQELTFSYNSDVFFVKIKNKRAYEINSNGDVELIKPIKDSTPGILSGKGTESNPYLIESVEDLVEFSKEVNEGKITNEYVKLNVDLNIYSYLSYNDYTTIKFNDYFQDELTLIEELTTKEGFIPIGTDKTNYFSGTFDGNNKTISGLYISREKNYVGLFGYANANIYDLNITNCKINNGQYIGACVGYSVDGNMSNIVCKGNIITGNNTTNLGGVIGSINLTGNSITMENIKNYVSIITENSKTNVGGVLGNLNVLTSSNTINIINCTNYGSIECKAGNAVGGIIGSELIGLNITSNDTYISKCSNIANIKVSTGKYIGGIFGNLYTNGGSTNQVIEECYNSGNIYCDCVIKAKIGGIEGNRFWQSTILKNSYNTGTIYFNNAQSCSVGGITGYMNGNTTTNCYNIGEIVSKNIESCFIGALIGESNSNISRITNCYYYMSTQIGICGGGNGQSSSISSYTTNLKNMAEILGSSYTNDEENINNGYPILKWQKST